MKKMICCLLALLLAGGSMACDAPAGSQTVEDGLSWHDELEADAAAHCTDNLELLNAVLPMRSAPTSTGIFTCLRTRQRWQEIWSG